MAGDPALYRWLADAVLVIHVAFVVFVVAGFAARAAALAFDIGFARTRRFRRVHSAAVAIVVLQAWAGLVCPLTRFENALRARAGEAGYGQSFVEYWLHRLLYYDAPAWVFVVVYTAFGALVAGVWLAERRRRRSGAT